jgi:hypothetical protein
MCFLFAANPYATHEVSLHPQTASVTYPHNWPNFCPTTLTTDVCLDISQEYVNQSDEQELIFDYFQRDKAMCYMSYRSLQEIRSISESRIISKGIWLSRSLDMVKLSL